VIAFETEVRVERPIREVFAYVSDPLELPHWNSAVREVRRSTTGGNDVGSRFVMERQLPGGLAVDELEIVGLEPPTDFTIRVTSGPTPFTYRYRFSAEGAGTMVRLEAEVELPRPARLVPQLAGRAVRRGVDDNFAVLRAILERARIAE
jgi:uncharacterized protein YndB with AHSA1/START domain